MKISPVFGVASMVLLYLVVPLVKVLGWVTLGSFISIFGSEHLRSQTLYVFQTLSQPIAIVLCVVFLMVALGLIEKNTPIVVSMWIAVSVALLFVVGDLIHPMISLAIFVGFLGPVLTISLLFLIIGIGTKIFGNSK